MTFFKKENTDLNAYPILKQLILLALPVIGSSFMTMAYNIINMIFVGKLGSGAVAAVGSAGFYTHLGWGLSSLLTVGAGIKVSHAIGSGDFKLSRSYVRSGILAVVLLALVYYAFIFFAGKQLISLIQLNNPEIEKAALSYLQVLGLVIPFTFQNLFFTSVFIGSGDSKSPFRINATALAINILLDYLLIIRAGMGIQGAAVGTIISQATGTFLFYMRLKGTANLKPIGTEFQSSLLKNILKMGVSTTFQRVSFTIVAIFMARIIASWDQQPLQFKKSGFRWKPFRL
jgi:putative MATE family efflux protein